MKELFKTVSNTNPTPTSKHFKNKCHLLLKDIGGD